MQQLSRKCLAVRGSVTLAIDSKAKALVAEGKNVVGFGAGEPDFQTPQYIKTAGVKAIEDGMTRYTPVAGTVSLRKAICNKLHEKNGLDYTPDQIVVSNGAKQSLYNTFYALCDEGDEVIIPGPYWVSYPEMVAMCGGTPVFVMADEAAGFKVTAKQIEDAITPKTKALLLNSPSNPTGAVYTREEMEQIAEVCVRHDIFVVSDEIYELLTYDGMEHISIASLGYEIKKRTILINGMSKAYCMTGWRIGYTASEIGIAKAMSNFQSHSTSNANSIAQYASEIGLNTASEEAQAMKAQFAARRDRLCALINAIPGLSCKVPGGAFYVFVNISGVIGKACCGKAISGSMDFADTLLEKELVAVVPGNGFGADNFVRLSYAISMHDIEEGLRRIEKFVSELN